MVPSKFLYLFWLIIIQNSFGIFLVGGRMILIPSTIAVTPSLHLVRFAASSTSNLVLFTSSSTCLLLVCFGLPRFCYPFASSINALFWTSSSSLLTTCPYHLTPFVFAIFFSVSFKPSISINSSLFFLFTNFSPHIDLTIALSVLKKFQLQKKVCLAVTTFNVKYHMCWTSCCVLKKKKTKFISQIYTHSLMRLVHFLCFHLTRWLYQYQDLEFHILFADPKGAAFGRPQCENHWTRTIR